MNRLVQLFDAEPIAASLPSNRLCGIRTALSRGDLGLADKLTRVAIVEQLHLTCLAVPMRIHHVSRDRHHHDARVRSFYVTTWSGSRLVRVSDHALEGAKFARDVSWREEIMVRPAEWTGLSLDDWMKRIRAATWADAEIEAREARAGLEKSLVGIAGARRMPKSEASW